MTKTTQKMKVSENAIKLIKEFEGFSSKLYRCPAGKLTIGYGHVVFGDAEIFKYKSGISEFEASQLIKQDCLRFEEFINTKLKVDYQSEFDALVSLLYNIGIERFKRSRAYTLLKARDFGAAVFQMFDAKEGFVKCDDKILKGLVARRQAEYELWFKDYARISPNAS